MFVDTVVVCMCERVQLHAIVSESSLFLDHRNLNARSAVNRNAHQSVMEH